MWKIFLLLGCAARFGFVFCDETQPDTVADVNATVALGAVASCGCGGYPPICKKNEVYNNCSDTGCRSYFCSELGFPLNCPRKCKPGCICKDGYVRNDKGVCIPINDCPSCGGDKNAQSGCGSNCGKTCASYNVKPVACPFSCRINGCDCRDGFAYDPNVKACVRPQDCTPTCKINEEYSSCVNGGCSPRNCSQVGTSVPCVDPVKCSKGCVCVKGYLRAANGTCVPQDQCTCYPPICKKNEVYNNCSDTGCRPYFCSELGFPLTCPRKCKPGCICKDGYVRDDKGVCIPINDCPSCGGDKNAQSGCGGNCGRTCATYKIKPPVVCPLGCILNGCNCRDGFVYDPNVKACVRAEDCTPTCKINEEYSSCVNGGCSPRNCSQVGTSVPCVDPVKCIKGCVCVKGYLRAANGTCVPQDQCTPTCRGQNEHFEQCIQGCSNQSCSDINQSFSCPAEPAGHCKSGCRCKPGFWRNNNNVCVSQDECPKPFCPDGEVWDWCPTVKCDGDYCAKTKDSPQTCPVGIVCDKPRCVCGYNRKRDWKTGKCISIPDCPPFKCDCNEEYKACPEQCYEENCSMYVNKTKCIPLKIGIIANCRPRCLCRKGYYRNTAGACVAPYECSTDCPQP